MRKPTDRPMSMSERLRYLRGLQAQLLGLGTGAYDAVTIVRADGREEAIEPPCHAADYAGLPAREVKQ